MDGEAREVVGPCGCCHRRDALQVGQWAQTSPEATLTLPDDIPLDLYVGDRLARLREVKPLAVQAQTDTA